MRTLGPAWADMPATRVRGLSNYRLKIVGLLFVMLSALSTAVVSKGMPTDLAQASMAQMTATVLLEAVSWMAYPVYAWLLYSGFIHTRSVRRYGLRLLVLAVVSEVPYDLATFGRPWDLRSQNPVFALVVALVVLAALRLLRERRSPGWGALSVLVCIAAAAWLMFFNVGLRLGVLPGGIVMLAFALVFFYFHRRENTMMGIGALLGAVAVLFPALGLGFVHFRNETLGPDRKYFFYVAYPIVLLAIGLFGLTF